MANVVALVFAASLSIGQSEELNEWADLNVGRWVGNVKYTVDYPGIAEKGDVVTGHVTIRWILDKSALEGQYHVGNGSGKWLTVWDASAKQLMRNGVSSDGSIWKDTIKKKSDNLYVFDSTTVFADGTKQTETSHFVYSKGGRKLVIEGSDRKRGGEPIPDFRDEWKRISK